MDNFTIYCTKEQTEKALKLCAPIDLFFDKNIVNTINNKSVFEYYRNNEKYTIIDGRIYGTPTAEQMIGWFDGHGIVIIVEDTNCATWYFKLEADGYVNKYNDYSSRKDATLAAIDAALEYLEACLSKTAIGC